MIIIENKSKIKPGQIWIEKNDQYRILIEETNEDIVRFSFVSYNSTFENISVSIEYFLRFFKKQ